MMFTGFNDFSILESDAISWFFIVNGTLSNDGTLPAIWCKYSITHTNITHGCIARWGRDEGIQGYLFPHFLRYLYIGSVELTVTVGLQDSEDVTYDLFLPINQFKRFAGPGAFGVAQGFNEGDCIVSSFLAVGTVLGFELCGLVPFQCSHDHAVASFLLNHKKASIRNRCW